MSQKALELFLTHNESAKQTIEIIARLLNHESPTTIAKELGVHRTWVYQVKSQYLQN